MKPSQGRYYFTGSLRLQHENSNNKKTNQQQKLSKYPINELPEAKTALRGLRNQWMPQS